MTVFKKKIALIGAGPAVLACAYELLKNNDVEIVIFEKDSQYLGGLSRTVKFDDNLIDIGGHRFFSTSKRVVDFWKEILPTDLLIKERKSRIFYNKSFFSYPLKPFEAFYKLGIIHSFLSLYYYLLRKVFPKKNTDIFSSWVSNRFGDHLFKVFFKTYTEKVWGMSCDSISSDWAEERIKNLSPFKAVINGLSGNRLFKIRTLTSEFYYPRRGPGMMWEACGEKIIKMGGEIKKGHLVTSLSFSDEKWRVSFQNNDVINSMDFDEIISSMPLSHLAFSLNPTLPREIITAAKNLKYRDFIIITLVIKGDLPFDDNWIYIHSPEVKLGRIQNFKAWSKEMVDKEDYYTLGLEYFCNMNDELWSLDHDSLVDFAKNELNKLKIIPAEHIIEYGHVIKQPKAYPVYNENYKQSIEKVTKYINSHLKQIYMIGRNGLHEYNNQDHSMLAGFKIADHINSEISNTDLIQNKTYFYDSNKGYAQVSKGPA